MPREEKEPQSYGSQGDWVSGETGQKVEQQYERTDVENAGFYESRTESANGPRQGDVMQPEWTDFVDVLEPAGIRPEVDDPAWKVTAERNGAKRSGFFKSRDYDR